MKKTITAKRVILRYILTVSCLLVYVWIFSNSLQSGGQSSGQSLIVTRAIQKIAGWFAPHSFIATATGEDFDRLHNAVRTLAHFSEFALLGALLVWCYLSYTYEKTFAFLPFALVLLTPIIDETIQSFTIGRAAEVQDLLIDTAGGFTGCIFALVTVWIGCIVYRKKKEKRLGGVKE